MQMSEPDCELVRGSGNVFRDFESRNADLEQARIILAAKIIEVLDDSGMSARAAEARTGVSHTDLSRIRNARLDRFTLDRMVAILGKLDGNIEVSIALKPRRRAKAA